MMYDAYMNDEERTVIRVAAFMANRVLLGGPITGGTLRHRVVAARDRDSFPAALAYAIKQQWLKLDGRRVVAGDVKPPPTTAQWYINTLDASSTSDRVRA